MTATIAPYGQIIAKRTNAGTMAVTWQFEGRMVLLCESACMGRKRAVIEAMRDERTMGRVAALEREAASTFGLDGPADASDDALVARMAA